MDPSTSRVGHLFQFPAQIANYQYQHVPNPVLSGAQHGQYQAHGGQVYYFATPSPANGQYHIPGAQHGYAQSTFPESPGIYFQGQPSGGLLGGSAYYPSVQAQRPGPEGRHNNADGQYRMPVSQSPGIPIQGQPPGISIQGQPPGISVHAQRPSLEGRHDFSQIHGNLLHASQVQMNAHSLQALQPGATIYGHASQMPQGPNSEMLESSHTDSSVPQPTVVSSNPGTGTGYIASNSKPLLMESGDKTQLPGCSITHMPNQFSSNEAEGQNSHEEIDSSAALDDPLVPVEGDDVDTLTDSFHGNSPSSEVNDTSVGDFVRLHCNGTLAKVVVVFCGLRIVIAKMKGSKLLCKSVRYLINHFMSDSEYCFGPFTAEQLRLTDEGMFYIACTPNMPKTRKNLQLSLANLIDLMLVHFTLDGDIAIYVHHLERFCKNVPRSVLRSKDLFDRFLEFVYYHISFGYSAERLDFLEGVCMLLKYCTWREMTYVHTAIAQAQTAYQKDPDWRSEIVNCPVLSDVLWDGLPIQDRNPDYLPKSPSAHDRFLFGRHSIVHGPERTLETIPLPPDQGSSVPKTIQIQPMTLKELDYIVGYKLGCFLTEGSWRFLRNRNLDSVDFLNERWNAFKRSIKVDEDRNDVDEDDDAVQGNI